MTSVPSPRPAVRWGALPRPLLGVFGATFLVRFAFGISTAVFTIYLLGPDASAEASAIGTAGLVIALSPIGEFTTVVLAGTAADRWGRSRVLAAGLITACGSTALFSLTRTPLLLGLLNFVFGIASGAILVASLALIAEHAGSEERGLEMGRFDAMNLAGWVVGFGVGFVLLAALPASRLADAFLYSALVLAVGAYVVLAYVRVSPSTGARTWPVRAVLGEALGRLDLWLVTLPWLVIYALIGTALAFLASSSSAVGLPPTYLALAVGVGGLALVFTQPMYGRASDRFGRRPLLWVGTAGFVTVSVAAAFIATYGPLDLLLAVAGVGILAALAYGPAALAALTDLSRSLTRATTMAIYSLSISLGMIVGLVASTRLYASLGTLGLDLFFGAIAVALAALTGAQGVRGILRTPAR